MAVDKMSSNSGTKTGAQGTPGICAKTGLEVSIGAGPEVSADDVPKVVHGEPEDGGWGWLVALGAFVSFMLSGGLDRSGGVFYITFLERYGGSAAETAWVLALFASFRVLFGPLASALVNRFSSRTVVFVGAVLCVAGLLVSGLTVSLPAIYVSYGICTGFGVAMIYTPGIILTGQYFTKRRGAVLGASSVGAGFGSFLLPPLIQLLFETYTFQDTFLLLSGIVSHSLVVAALYRPLSLHRRLVAMTRSKDKWSDAIEMSIAKDPLLLPPAKAPELKLSSSNISNITASLDIIYTHPIGHEDAEKSTDAIGNKIGERKYKQIFNVSLLKDCVFICLCLNSFLFLISYNITITFLPALVKDSGLTPFQGSSLISIMGISDAVSRLVAAVVLDLKHLKPYRLYIFNSYSYITLIISVILPSVNKFWQFALLCVIYGSFTGTFISQLFVVIIDIIGVDNLSSGLGIVLGVNGLGALLAPITGGLLKDSFGSYTPAFYCGSVGLLLSGVVMTLANVCLRQRINQQRK